MCYPCIIPSFFLINQFIDTFHWGKDINNYHCKNSDPYNSGPLGGDQQIGAKIVEGNIDMVIFFSDPLAAQPHDPDVKALLRIAQVYDIPIANNIATADFMIYSTFMNEQYSHQIENFKNTVDVRVKEMQ